LTVGSFVKAGYGLKNVLLPGTNAPISFGSNRPYALGPGYMVHYDPSTKELAVASKPATDRTPDRLGAAVTRAASS
jgi:hypothetical protein